ncbi:MAG: type II secretion system F family protein [Candidatus Sericytochromatia bacterium]
MLTFLLIFLLTAFGIGAVTQLAFPARHGAVSARLDAMATPSGTAALHAPAPKGGGALQVVGRVIEPWVSRTGYAERLERMLFSAGMPWRVGEFVALVAFSLVMGAVVGKIVGGPAALFAGAAVGAAVPFWQVKRKAAAKMRALNDQLPDALMLIVNALRAGNSLTQAMGVVSQQMPAPISTSFGHTLQDINYGLPVDAALDRLQETFGGIDMALVTSAILVQRETGGNLAEILSNIHSTIRDRQTVQGEMRALTAQGRMSGWVLSLLPAGIGGLFYLLNRAYIMTLFQDPRGQLLVGGAVCLTIIGMLAIRKIVDVQY